MTLSDACIQRPILSWMMTLAFIVFGVLGYNRLAVDQFPNMEFPVLTATATLEGASPECMEEDVVDVLEEYLSTIAGVRSIRSTSFASAAQIVVEFELGMDLDIAAQDVRDKVARARRDLPAELEPPTVGNFNPNDQPVLWIPIHLAGIGEVEASEYVRRQINPFVETIPGVAGVTMFGRLDRNIRIWLNGEQLRARGLTSGDIIAAIRREHIEIPGGLVESRRVEYSVKTDAEFRTIAELEDLVVAEEHGAQVRLADVARIEDGAQDVDVIARYNGRPTVGLGIRKQSGGNTVGIVDEVLKRLDSIRGVLPDGMEIYDSGGFIDFSKGVREIAFAAAAATVSVAAVFIPAAFVEGPVGAFLGEFGLTVAGSVMISLFSWR